jgi:hypothetical protein
VSLVVIVALIGGLVVKIRQVDRRRGSRPRSEEASHE